MCNTKSIQEVSRAASEIERPLRWESAEIIARKFLRANMDLYLELIEEAMSLLNIISLGRVQSFQTLLRLYRRDQKKLLKLTEKRGDPKPEDIAQLIGELSRYLNTEQVLSIVQIFDDYTPRFFDSPATSVSGGVWNQYLPQAWQDGYNEAYESLLRASRSKTRRESLEANLPGPIVFNPNSPIINSFYAVTFQRVTSKISIAAKGEFLGAMLEGFRNGHAWEKIARNVFNRAGMGYLWHFKRLVRTEMVFAATETHIHSFQEAGIEFIKFSTSIGACPICTPKAGYWRLENSPKPPLHPNCRCLLIPVYRLPSNSTLLG